MRPFIGKIFLYRNERAYSNFLSQGYSNRLESETALKFG